MQGVFMFQTKRNIFFKIIALFVLINFGITVIGPLPTSTAQEAFSLPTAGKMVGFKDPAFPILLKGVKVFPDNPLRFDFVIDQGNVGAGPRARPVFEKLIKYFLASLTVPEDDLWVNLSPDEPDRIIPNKLGETEMGRDLLAQDFMLKQITASLMNPEGELGEQFWERIYAEAYAKYGTTDIPVDVLNKVWIVPEKAVVYENDKTNTAFVIESRLKVMVEEDYLLKERSRSSLVARDSKKHSDIKRATRHQRLATNLIREIIIPAIEREINEGQTFANLRQIYHSLILATWYKRKLKQSFLGRTYINQNKTDGIDIEDKTAKQKIYTQYLEAFKQGAYDYIKEEYDSNTQEIVPRKYFAGGTAFTDEEMNLVMVVIDKISESNISLGDDAAMISMVLDPTKNDTAMTASSVLKNNEINLYLDDVELYYQRKKEIRALLQQAVDANIKSEKEFYILLKKILEFKGAKSTVIMEVSREEGSLGAIAQGIFDIYPIEEAALKEMSKGAQDIWYDRVDPVWGESFTPAIRNEILDALGPPGVFVLSGGKSEEMRQLRLKVGEIVFKSMMNIIWKKLNVEEGSEDRRWIERFLVSPEISEDEEKVLRILEEWKEINEELFLEKYKSKRGLISKIISLQMQILNEMQTHTIRTKLEESFQHTNAFTEPFVFFWGWIEKDQEFLRKQGDFEYQRAAGYAAVRNGEVSKAVKSYRKALEIFPDKKAIVRDDLEQLAKKGILIAEDVRKELGLDKSMITSVTFSSEKEVNEYLDPDFTVHALSVKTEETKEFTAKGSSRLSVFGSADEELWENEYPMDKNGNVTLGIHPLLVEDKVKGEYILIDPGPSGEEIIKALDAKGIYPKDIKKIILSHGHWDHAGALTYEGKPTFPNADVYVSETIKDSNWSFFKEDHFEYQIRRDFRSKAVSGILISSKINIKYIPKNQTTISEIKGIKFIWTGGHTGHHLRLEIGKLFYGGDESLTRVHVENFMGAPTEDSELSRETWNTIRQRAEKTGGSIYAYHDIKNPFIKIIQEGDDSSMITSPITKGGIDFNANALPLDVQGAEIDFDFTQLNLPCTDDDKDEECEGLDMKALEQMSITGFTPVILNIVPLQSISTFLGLGDNQEEEVEEIERVTFFDRKQRPYLNHES